MAGVWLFGSDGVVKLQQAAGGGGGGGGGAAAAAEEWNSNSKKVLVWRETGEAIQTLEELEEKLFHMGWHRIITPPLPEASAAAAGGGRERIIVRHYHRPANGPYLLTLPLLSNSSEEEDHPHRHHNLLLHSLHPIHLYNIAVQTRDAFLVRDAAAYPYLPS